MTGMTGLEVIESPGEEKVEEVEGKVEGKVEGNVQEGTGEEKVVPERGVDEELGTR